MSPVCWSVHKMLCLLSMYQKVIQWSWRDKLVLFKLGCFFFFIISLNPGKIFAWHLFPSHTQMHIDLSFCQTLAPVCDCLSADACTHWLCTEKPSGKPKPSRQLKFWCTSGWPQKQTFPRTWPSFMKISKTIETKYILSN